MATPVNNNLDYIDSTDFSTLENRLCDLKKILDDNGVVQADSRELRYAEVDIEQEREAQRLAPDELYIPQHIIDTNIRNEQAFYVQYVAEPTRAVVCQDEQSLSMDMSLLEQDLTKKLRFPGWQLSMFANIDAFQSYGYSVMETVMDKSAPGGISREVVQKGDFAFVCDTRDLQAVEMCCRQYYFTATKLKRLSDPAFTKPEDLWSDEQVKKVIDGVKNSSATTTSDNVTDSRDRSLFRIHKIMFKVKGVVNVAWTCIETCDGWLRDPRPLFLGRRILQQPGVMDKLKALIPSPTPQLPPSSEAYETQYPYFLYPYLISENDTITQLKGRIFLDQDAQEAITSLLSSTVTQARRAAGMYFSKDASDPNDDFLMQKNVYFKTGTIINGKVQAFDLKAPDPGIFSAINLLVAAKQGETSQVSTATNNRKDSRKTAKESDLASQKQQQLSTVQVVLFSIALTLQYTFEVEIIKSRVLAGLITVDPQVRPFYDRTFKVKPSGDSDVVEKQKLIETMMSAWPVVQATAAAGVFLIDLLELMFPSRAAKYVKALNDAQAQAASGQAQQMQQVMAAVSQLSQGIIELSKKPEMFSDTGRVHAFPLIENAATQLQAILQPKRQ